jgi:predicted DCC family thiol-disulfide oxidoreductase YuxK
VKSERGERSDPASIAELLPPSARLVVIYDGWCGVCTRSVRWIRRRDPEGRIAVLPNQQPGLRERIGLSKDEVDRFAWAIDAAGRRFRGAAAINRVFEELGRWRYLAPLYRLPVVRQVEDLLYHWFSVNRGRFARWGITPACERPGAACLPEGA